MEQLLVDRIDNQELTPEDIAAGDGSHVAPRNATERALTQIWSEVLEIDPEEISLEHNFFEIGGHSLAAATVAQQIQKKFKKNVTIRAIFENPKISELSKVVSKAPSSNRSEGKKASSHLRSDRLPMLKGQVSFWITLKSRFLSSHKKPGNVNEIFSMQGSLDFEIFQRAVDEVARTHDSLWCSFSINLPVARMGRPAKARVELIDVSDSSAGDQEKLLRDAIDSVFTPLFELRKAPLFRLALVKTSAAQSFLLVSLPHVVSDYASINAFIREIFARYDQILEGVEAAPLQKSSLSDMIYSEQTYLQSEECARDAAFWEKVLENPKPLLLKREHFRHKPTSTGNQLLTKIHFPEQTLNQLKKITAEINTSVQMMILALIKATLYSFSGQSDIGITMMIDARGIHPHPPVLNINVSSIVVRTDFLKISTYTDLLLHIKQYLIEAHSHIQYPLTTLIYPISALKNKPLTAWLARLSGTIFSWRYRASRGDSKMFSAMAQTFWALRVLNRQVRKKDKSLRLSPPIVYNALPNFYENPTFYSTDALKVTNLRQRELIMSPNAFAEGTDCFDGMALCMDLIRDQDNEAFLYLWGGGFNRNAFERMQELFQMHLDCLIKDPTSQIAKEN